MRWLGALAAISVLALPGGPAAALDAPAAVSAVKAVLDREYPSLEALYRDLHAHPELGFQETRSAARLAAEMRALGFEVTEQVGGTGVVAILRNGPGPVVMVRTELDGLPMEEKTGLPYASRRTTEWNGVTTFVAHACGHDVHMTAWVGAARSLVAARDRWRGTLFFIAQPSEETLAGARAMLDDGLFRRFEKPDYAFALHVTPAQAGQVHYKSGVFTSNADSLDLTFNGRGGHGARPADTVDPVMMAARFVVDVQSVISREKDPAAFGVVTIGSIQAGSVGNIIPDSARLRGTLRSYDGEVRARMIEGVRRTAKAVADMAGAPAPDLAITSGGTAVVNDEALARRTAAVFVEAFGADAVAAREPSAASEDFSEFILAGVPAFAFAIGGSDPALVEEARKTGRPLPANHSPFFAPAPEPTIRTGVTAMTLAVLQALEPQASEAAANGSPALPRR